MKELIHQFRLYFAEMLMGLALDIIPDCPEGQLLSKLIVEYVEKVIDLRRGNGE